jgi:hypothetical protein
MKPFSALALLSFFLIGCASRNDFMYKSTCTSNTWENVGEKDGERGVKDVGTWTSRCQQFGTQPDVAKYDKGQALGIKRFCQTQGYNQGKKGEPKDLHNSCIETALKPAFENGYSIGLHELCTPELGTQHALQGQIQQEICKGIPPYTQSYDYSLKEFCTPGKAFKTAVEKKEYNLTVCDSKKKGLLLAAHHRGKKLVEAREKVVALEADIRDLTKKTDDVATPADAKKHYEQVLTTKKTELKNTERTIFSLEAEEKRL